MSVYLTGTTWTSLHTKNAIVVSARDSCNKWRQHRDQLTHIRQRIEPRHVLRKFVRFRVPDLLLGEYRCHGISRNAGATRSIRGTVAGRISDFRGEEVTLLATELTKVANWIDAAPVGYSRGHQNVSGPEADVQRTAQCSCGSVKVIVAGDPSAVVACHCLECERRTGSVLGVGASFLEERITLSGVTKQFARATQSGLPFVTHFCPTCGTSVYWRAGKIPGLVGVAVGAFADPSFPPPLRSVWEQSRHDWIEVSAAQQHFPQGRQ